MSSVRCWPAKLASAPSSSTADERTANGPPNGRAAAATCSTASSCPPATASTIGPERATPGGTGRPSRSACPRPTAFEPKTAVSATSASETGGRPVQSPPWARKSPVGTTALAVKRMCWLIIAAWWSRQRPRYSTSSSSESASGSTDCSSRCFAIAFGLYVSSHSRELLAPELARHHLGRPLEALRDLLLRRGQLGHVADAVDVLHREAAHRHPVEAGEVGRARANAAGWISVQ